jgi:hypothetical protein
MPPLALLADPAIAVWPAYRSAAGMVARAGDVGSLRRMVPEGYSRHGFRQALDRMDAALISGNGRRRTS